MSKICATCGQPRLNPPSWKSVSEWDEMLKSVGFSKSTPVKAFEEGDTLKYENPENSHDILFLALSNDKKRVIGISMKTQ